MHDIRSRLRGLLQLLLLALVGLALDAHALIQPQPGTQPIGDAAAIFGQPTVSACQSTASYAAYGGCKYVVYAFASGVSTGSSCAGSVRWGPGYCHVLQRADSGFGSNTYSTSWRTTGGACPANSTAVTGGCQCNSGWIQNPTATACVQQPSELEQICSPKAGQAAGSWNVAGYQASSACDMVEGKGGGCLVTLDGFKISIEDTPGNWWTQGKATYTGGTCQGSATEPPATVQPPAPAASAPAGASTTCVGGTSGQVNGVDVCVKIPPNLNVSSSEGSSSNTTKPDGTQENVQKQQQAQCQSGQCTVTTTTTTTTKDAQGNVTGTGTVINVTQATKAQFCADNPGNAQCNLQDDGGGDCDRDPSRLACLQLGTPGEGVIPTNNVQIGTPGVYDMVGFNLTDAPVAGASWEVGCPAPLTFEVFGRTLALSFEGFCRAAQWIRYLVWLASALVALYIVYSALIGARD